MKIVPFCESTAVTIAAGSISGAYCLYDAKEVSGRFRITNREDRAGKAPIGANVTDWVEKKYLK